MRSFWNAVPMFRIALLMIMGIWIYISLYLKGNISSVYFIAAVVCLIICFIIFITIDEIKDHRLSYRLRHFSGVAMNSSLVLLGFSLAWLHTDDNFPSHFSKHLVQNSSLSVTINEPPQIKENVVRAFANVIQVTDSAGNSIPVQGKLMLAFIKDSFSTELAYGDLLLIHKEISEIDPPRNPGEFNLKTHHAFHQIYHQAFLLKYEWKRLAVDQGNFFFKSVYRIRNQFIGVLEKYITNKKDLAVASAILLGYRDFMRGDVMNAYAGAGVLHVLCVSGLHVGIFFFLLNMILKPMDNKGKKWKYVKSTLIIVFIWFYAVITGLSPSVLRAATMFSILQIGIMIARHTNIYNTIAGSAVILMVLNPFIITQIGFQLSYLAVLGIVYLYPKIYPLFTLGSSDIAQYKLHNNYVKRITAFFRYDLKWFAWKILNGAWQILVVSLSAQLATSPLSLFYFHQFPNLFLIANLVVIPLSSILMYSGVFLLLFSPVPMLAEWPAGVLNIILHELNHFIFLFQKIPYAMTEGISIGVGIMLLMYVFLLLFFWFIESGKFKTLIAAIFTLLFVCSLWAFDEINRANIKQVAVYDIPKHRALAFLNNNQAYPVFDQELLTNHSSLRFHIKPHWWENGVEKESDKNVAVHTIDLGKLFLFEGKKVLLVDSDIRNVPFELQNKLHADIVVLSNNRTIYIDQLPKILSFTRIVFDSSNNLHKTNRWAQECSQLGFKYWNVKTDGAFVYDI